MTGLAWLLAFFALGCAAGACHFQLLRWNVGLFLGRGRAVAAIGLHLGRLLLTTAVLTLAAFQGWAPLLACAAGILAARQAAVRGGGARP